MKISYILQLNELFILLIIGFLLGVFYDIINIPLRIKKNIYLQIICDIIFSIVTFTLFTISINIINLGEFRLFLLIGYILGFIIERISLSKLFAKGVKKLYTILVNCFKTFSKTKLGRIIFK